jgi:hypothetical protein
MCFIPLSDTSQSERTMGGPRARRPWRLPGLWCAMGYGRIELPCCCTRLRDCLVAGCSLPLQRSSLHTLWRAFWPPHPPWNSARRNCGGRFTRRATKQQPCLWLSNFSCGKRRLESKHALELHQRKKLSPSRASSRGDNVGLAGTH